MRATGSRPSARRRQKRVRPPAPPRSWQRLAKRYPVVVAAYDALSEVCRQAGPLDEATVALMKLAVSIGGRRRADRPRAHQEGAPRRAPIPRRCGRSRSSRCRRSVCRPRSTPCDGSTRASTSRFPTTGSVAASRMRILPVMAIGFVLSGGADPLFAQCPPPVEIGGVTISGSLRMRVESSELVRRPRERRTYTYPVARPHRGRAIDGTPRLASRTRGPVHFRSARSGGGAWRARADGPGRELLRGQRQPRRRRVAFRQTGVPAAQGQDGQSLKVGPDGLRRRHGVSSTTRRWRHSNAIASRIVSWAISALRTWAAASTGSSTLLTGSRRTSRSRRAPDGKACSGRRLGRADVAVVYGAATGQLGGAGNAGEWRIFGLAYRDGRDNVVKTDNRPLAVRRGDTEPITIGTFGGHYLRAATTTAGLWMCSYGAPRNPVRGVSSRIGQPH